MRNDTPWYEYASCRNIDPELWFPPAGGTGSMARRICRRCEVKSECLADGLEYEKDTPYDYRWGIVGGLDPRQRRTLLEGLHTDCGTIKGWRRHVKDGEDPCPRCATAVLKQRHKVPTQRNPS